MENEIQRAITAIDRVVDIALKWMNETPSFIRTEIMRVFSGTNPELVSHYIDKWDGDFSEYYLNMDEGMKRKFFCSYNIPLEPDKLKSGTNEFYMAMLKTKDKFKILPFESHIVHLFYLTAYNNSLELLKDLSQQVFSRIVTNKINLYGNGLNWSKAWTLLTYDEKAIFVKNILIMNSKN
jgi:hypothetical protein